MNNKKPKILMIGALPPPAIGPFVAMQKLIQSPIIKEKFTIDFLDISDHRAFNMGQLDFYNLVLGVKHAFQCLLRLLFGRPGVVYVSISQGTWGFLRDLSFILPSLLFRRSLVLHLRGSEFRTFYAEMPGLLRWVTRWVMARTKRMIVLGEGLKQIFSGLISPDRIAVIPNGIDYDAYLPSSKSLQKSPSKRILFLSSLKRRKGLFVLIESMAIVFEQHPDAVITIAGRWRSQSEQKEAEALIEGLNIGSKLNFVGEVMGEDKIQLFLKNDVFVFTPVEPEGLPWVILEAMSAALPIVTSDQGAITEVVVPDQTGLIVPPTPQKIAESVCFLLDNPDQAQALGNRGRKRVEKEFSEKSYTTKLIEVFHQALE